MTNPIRRAWRGLEDPLTFLRQAGNKLYSLWLGATYPFASVGRKLSTHYPCHLRRPQAAHIAIGNLVIIGKDTLLHIVGEEPDTIKLTIDDNCAIGARSVISAKNSIVIERDVITGMSVLIQDHQHARERADLSIRDQGVTAGGRIRIEQGCWIGQGAAILCNESELVIGRNSVVGVNSVVVRSVPPNSVIIGNPGIALKQMGVAKSPEIAVGAGLREAGERRDDIPSPAANSSVSAGARKLHSSVVRA
jgi:acetyltransferase-like isoleucine patch superfamily enzyme